MLLFCIGVAIALTFVGYEIFLYVRDVRALKAFAQKVANDHVEAVIKVSGEAVAKAVAAQSYDVPPVGLFDEIVANVPAPETTALASAETPPKAKKPRKRKAAPKAKGAKKVTKKSE